ncbi:MAG TPA: pyridoxamine 5'-phosphate oxidase family protein [Chitinophagaceae bacterium]
MPDENYLSILSLPVAMWAANRDENNIPDVVHCNGIVPTGNCEKLTFFISAEYSDTFLANLKVSPALTLLVADIYTFRSYQYKGNFESMRDCTPEEVVLQQKHLRAFSDAIGEVGHSNDGFYDAYNLQPSFAVTFLVTDIFEQTPRKGTGQCVAKP